MNTAGMKIETLICGPLQTNTIIISAEKSQKCWVIDPAAPVDELLEHLRGSEMQVQAIIATHGHGDHISGVDAVKQAYPEARFMAPKDDNYMLDDAMSNMSAPFGMPVTASAADKLLEAGQSVEIAGNNWKVLDTSGHSPGGISLYCAEAELCICGDALFAGSIGRTDFPGADQVRLVENIRRELLSLEGQTILIPGHGPATTVEAEMQNPFLR